MRQTRPISITPSEYIHKPFFKMVTSMAPGFAVTEVKGVIIL